MSNLIDHAKRELAFAGYDLNQTEENPNKWICQNILELLEVFSNQGHSGFSAPYCIAMFEKLASFKPLGPLKGTDDEWNEIGEGLYQNKRCSHVFKQADRFDGQAYDSQAVVFYDWVEQFGEDGTVGRFKSHYTSRDSSRPITFPYEPTTVYEERP